MQFMHTLTKKELAVWHADKQAYGDQAASAATGSASIPLAGAKYGADPSVLMVAPACAARSFTSFCSTGETFSFGGLVRLRAPRISPWNRTGSAASVGERWEVVASGAA